MRPQDVVAILLTLIVCFFIGSFAVEEFIARGNAPEYIVGYWNHIISILIGGLITYMATKDR